jgi:hypothetical protein
VPWWGLVVATCLAEDGIPAAPIAVRAKAWTTWGAYLAAARLAPGAVLVFDRAGGGHVGFDVGEDPTSYHVLGGKRPEVLAATSGVIETTAPPSPSMCTTPSWAVTSQGCREF